MIHIQLSSRAIVDGDAEMGNSTALTKGCQLNEVKH